MLEPRPNAGPMIGPQAPRFLLYPPNIPACNCLPLVVISNQCFFHITKGFLESGRKLTIRVASETLKKSGIFEKTRSDESFQ